MAADQSKVANSPNRNVVVSRLLHIVSEMTYNVSMGTLNPTIRYLSRLLLLMMLTMSVVFWNHESIRALYEPNRKFALQASNDFRDKSLLYVLKVSPGASEPGKHAREHVPRQGRQSVMEMEIAGPKSFLPSFPSSPFLLPPPYLPLSFYWFLTRKCCIIELTVVNALPTSWHVTAELLGARIMDGLP